MSYRTNMEDSWCNMYDELMETPQKLKKEVLECSNIIDSLKIGLNKSFSKSQSDITSIVPPLKDMTSDLNKINQLSLSEILSLEYLDGQLTELELLKHQTYVSGQLKKYASTCKDNFDEFDYVLHLPKLEWLLKTSLYLSKKRHQKDIKLKRKNNGIQRNSYEFCNYGYKCNSYQNNKCFQKHFVYNFVNSDICELIKYLTQSNLKENKNTKEIYITINTINFVFNHMYDELVNFQNAHSSQI